MSFEFSGTLYPTYFSAVVGAVELFAGGESLAGMSAADVHREMTSESAWGEITIKTPEGPLAVTVDDVGGALHALTEMPF